MPYEIAFTSPVTITDREHYINECCVAGDQVAAAHAKNIVHRDLTPDNIFNWACGGQKIENDFPRLSDSSVAVGSSVR